MPFTCSAATFWFAKTSRCVSWRSTSALDITPLPVVTTLPSPWPLALPFPSSRPSGSNGFIVLASSLSSPLHHLHLLLPLRVLLPPPQVLLHLLPHCLDHH